MFIITFTIMKFAFIHRFAFVLKWSNFKLASVESSRKCQQTEHSLPSNTTDNAFVTLHYVFFHYNNPKPFKILMSFIYCRNDKLLPADIRRCHSAMSITNQYKWGFK